MEGVQYRRYAFLLNKMGVNMNDILSMFQACHPQPFPKKVFWEILSDPVKMFILYELELKNDFFTLPTTYGF